MFNLLPADIKNISSDKVLHFKTKLDKFFSKIPDEPTSAEQGMATYSNKPSFGKHKITQMAEHCVQHQVYYTERQNKG